jgi:hypothetical protein
MTQKTYAAHAGLSRARICQLVRQGMPLDSPESADAWRACNTLARKLPPPAPAPAALPAPEAPERPPELPTEDVAAGACEPVRAAWERLLQAERLSWSSVVQSIKARQPDASRLVAVHALTVKNLIDGRARVLQQAQAERELVPGSWVKRIMQDHDGVVSTLARNMPRQLAGRVNPTDPCHAERELDRWLNETFLATLSSTDPWKP